MPTPAAGILEGCTPVPLGDQAGVWNGGAARPGTPPPPAADYNSQRAAAAARPPPLGSALPGSARLGSEPRLAALPRLRGALEEQRGALFPRLLQLGRRKW